MASILGVGIATLDIVNQVDVFPAEDSEVRAVAQDIRRGGNVTNTLVVLSQLGHHCRWAGTLADDAGGELIYAELSGYGINLSGVRRVRGGRTPTSYITLNRANGSRTIVHYRQLPEYPAADFLTLDISGVDWLHFEGRNIDETRRMLEALHSQPSRPRCSLEIEKPREHIDSLLGLADVMFYSRHYAHSRGYDTQGVAPDFLYEMARLAPQAAHICTWGGDGAYAIGTAMTTDAEAGTIHYCPAFAPAVVVDTVGAGDTFIAAFIHASVAGQPLPAALQFASRLAGKKCGQSGLANLV